MLKELVFTLLLSKLCSTEDAPSIKWADLSWNETLQTVSKTQMSLNFQCCIVPSTYFLLTPFTLNALFAGAVCAVEVLTAAVRWGWSFVCSSVLGASSPLTGGPHTTLHWFPDKQDHLLFDVTGTCARLLLSKNDRMTAMIDLIWNQQGRQNSSCPTCQGSTHFMDWFCFSLMWSI